jgi:hypothetical protein
LLSRVLAPLLAVSPLLAFDPFSGSWNLSLAKSKLAGPYAAIRAERLIIREQGDDLSITAMVTRQDGSSVTSNESVARNGGDLRYGEGAPPPGISRSVRRLSGTIIEIATLRNGKQLQLDRCVVTKRRTELRITRKGTDLAGERFESVEILDRE